MTNNEHISIMADTYKLLGDYTRLRIVLTCLNNKTAVGDIAEQLGVSQSLVSHHLRLLKAAKIITIERKSRQVFCSIADNHVSHMLTDMLEHITNC